MEPVVVILDGWGRFVTDKAVLRMQSDFLSEKMSMLGDATEWHVTGDESLADILKLVAVPFDKPCRILTYPGLDSEWFKSRMYELVPIYRLIHEWGLQFMCERFKRELHCHIADSPFSWYDVVANLENAIQPVPDRHFFRQCYGVVLGCRVLGNCSYQEEIFDESSSAIWREEKMNLYEELLAVDKDAVKLRNLLKRFALDMPKAIYKVV